MLSLTLYLTVNLRPYLSFLKISSLFLITIITHSNTWIVSDFHYEVNFNCYLKVLFLYAKVSTSHHCQLNPLSQTNNLIWDLERSLPTPDFCNLNPAISKFYVHCQLCWKAKIKKKRLRLAH